MFHGPRKPWGIDEDFQDPSHPGDPGKSKSSCYRYYCWWQPEIRQTHQLRLVVDPIIYKVLYIPGGAGFQPSTVVTSTVVTLMEFFEWHQFPQSWGLEMLKDLNRLFLLILIGGRRWSFEKTECQATVKKIAEYTVKEDFQPDRVGGP